MALLPRDRRRLKAIISDKPEEDTTLTKKHHFEEQYHATKIKAPESTPSTAAGLTKTNWELEIKKRYAQTLFAESLEFPDPNTVLARMVPICYEESVGAGTTPHCAEMVVSASEVYLKTFLGDIFNRTRSNGPRYENGAGGGILTSTYKRVLIREEDDVKVGRLARNRDDNLLPAESFEAKMRKPIGMNDLKFASRIGPTPWNGMPLLGMQVNEAPTENEYDDWVTEKDARGLNSNGILDNGVVDDMDVDDDDYGWEGTGMGERDALSSLLDECLAVRA